MVHARGFGKVVSVIAPAVRAVRRARCTLAIGQMQSDGFEIFIGFFE